LSHKLGFHVLINPAEHTFPSVTAKLSPKHSCHCQFWQN